MNVRIIRTGVLAALAVFSFGSVAAAQDWESGDTGAWQQPPPDQQQQQPPPDQQQQQQQQWGQQQQPQQQGWQQQQQQQQQGWQQQQEQPPGWGEQGAAEEEDGASDHSTVVGNFGVGFFGVTTLPIGTLFDDGMGGAAVRISAPTVGIRYWFSESLGLDATLGIGYLNNRAESGDTILEDLSAFGFAVHAGLPVVFMHEQHYKFLLIPEATLGISDGSSGDVLLKGMMFEIGARLGAEIHFGFIDVPQLSLQGTIGAHLSYESTVLDVDPDLPTTDSSALTFGTSVQAEPWDIFVGAITAIYYFR